MNSQNHNYKILSINELNKIEEEKFELIDSSYILDANGVFVTKFKDGTGILRPPVLSSNQGIFFDSIHKMDEMINSGVYPINNNSYWGLQQEKVINFEYEIPQYLKRLSDLIQFDVEINYDEKYLDKLSKEINLSLKSKRNKEEKYYLIGIYIGELLRSKKSAEWKILPQKSFNVYYEPELFIFDKNCHLWPILFGKLNMSNIVPFDVKHVLDNWGGSL